MTTNQDMKAYEAIAETIVQTFKDNYKEPDKTYDGQVTASLGNNKYSVRFGAGTNTVISINGAIFSIGDSVKVTVPCNNLSKAYITNSVATVSGGSSYTLPTASTTVLGGIKADGVTIIVNPTTGIASSAGGSGEFINIDGGRPDSNYGGMLSINAGGVI